jgi:biotin synthase
MSNALRHDWSTNEVLAILQSPLLKLIERARTVHSTHHSKDSVQLASLLSLKTGGCPEDCKYCPQSAHHPADVGNGDLMAHDQVLAAAREAKELGASRFCMGAAWRQVRDGTEFDSVLNMVRDVGELGMETCVTLGMLTQSQAGRLAEAGLTAYNHNLDTSPEYYDKIISTHDFKDRMETLRHVREAGISLCVGGIIGMGESDHDRARMLEILAGLDPHPESVPINALVAVAGTPLEDRPPVEPFDLVRMCACARILMPESRVRLSAGRRQLSREAQLLCFLAGANSIFYGETLLTTANAECEEDRRLLRELGLSQFSFDANKPTPATSAA